MRYIIFVIDTESGSGSGDEMANIDRYNQMLMEKGHWIMAAGIAGPSRATLIDNRDSQQIEAKSLFGDPHFYSGFWLVNAKDEAEARDLALAGSKACNRKVELRPLLGG